MVTGRLAAGVEGTEDRGGGGEDPAISGIRSCRTAMERTLASVLSKLASQERFAQEGVV